MTRKFSLVDDGWQPIKTAPKDTVTRWGLDDYDPSTNRFAPAYMMQRGGPEGSEWYCGMRRVHPAFWQHVTSEEVTP